MTRQRDSQRSRVYTAEQAVAWPEHTRRPLTLEQAQRYVDSVTKSLWWRNRCSTTFIPVKGGNRNGQAAYWSTWNGPEIRTSPGSRRQWVLLHELAHHLTRRVVGASGHGPEYAANYLALVKQFVGPDTAAALRASFVERRVKHRCRVSVGRKSAPASRVKREMTTCSCGKRFNKNRGWYLNTHEMNRTRFCTKKCLTLWVKHAIKQAA